MGIGSYITPTNKFMLFFQVQISNLNLRYPPQCVLSFSTVLFGLIQGSPKFLQFGRIFPF